MWYDLPFIMRPIMLGTPAGDSYWCHPLANRCLGSWDCATVNLLNLLWFRASVWCWEGPKARTQRRDPYGVGLLVTPLIPAVCLLAYIVLINKPRLLLNSSPPTASLTKKYILFYFYINNILFIKAQNIIRLLFLSLLHLFKNNNYIIIIIIIRK